VLLLGTPLMSGCGGHDSGPAEEPNVGPGGPAPAPTQTGSGTAGPASPAPGK
jgi:hypothetical protein